ncbi:hypothetical protein M0R45_019739 [Rubus argutus]|uniref:RING-type domain-containing protein n=1 Tax=Rubus argutus TaxID=59490 RepID=A0AAW1X8P6_RUBAR
MSFPQNCVSQNISIKLSLKKSLPRLIARDIHGLLPLLTLVVFVDYKLEHEDQLAWSSSSSNNINNHEDEELGLEKVRPDCLEAKKQQSCAICIPDCLHLLHGHCIRPWLDKSLSCPLCRWATIVELLKLWDKSMYF